MRYCLSIFGGVCLTFLALGGAMSVPRPYVPGEVLVQVRIPAMSRDKSGAPAYALPPLIEKELAANGLVSARPLSNPSRGNKSVGVGEDRYTCANTCICCFQAFLGKVWATLVCVRPALRVGSLQVMAGNVGKKHAGASWLLRRCG